MSRVVIEVKENKKYWIGRNCHIDIVDNHLEIKPEDKSRTYKILFPNGVGEISLEVLMGEILNAYEMNDSETVTLVIKQIKDLPSRESKQLIGDNDLNLDDNLFVVYLEETYQREIFIFSNIKVEVC